MALSSDELGIPGISDAAQVGQGGFGVVYRARQEAVGRTVAVKVLSVPALGEANRRRFERECRALGALSGHPNIVAVFDSGISGEQRPYLVMDYLPGGTLGERLERDGPLSWQAAADVGVKLAGALGAAHAAGVLHRDVKPDNVLMSAYEEPQLVDFGIARLLGGSQSHVGEITATLAHAAPEVLAGHPATQASDVYSLASTLYELLSGHAPFVRSTDETFHPLLERVRSEDPPDLREAGVPEAFWQPLNAALVKDPSQRVPTARALAEALRQAQRTLQAEVTPLVLPLAADDTTADRRSGAQANTILGLRRRREPTAIADQPVVTSRRRWLLLAAGLASALLLLAAGAAALIDTDDKRAPEKLATTVPTATATATIPGSTADGEPARGSGPSRNAPNRSAAPATPPAPPPPPAATPSDANSRKPSATGSVRPKSPAAKPRKRPETKTPTTPAAPSPTPQPSPQAPAAPPAPVPPAAPPPAAQEDRWEAPGAPNGGLHCGASKSVNSPTGSATVQQCVHVDRSKAGPTSYRGLLKVVYRSDRVPVKAGMFYGIHRPMIDGRFSGFRGCGNTSFRSGEEKWCYTGVEMAGAGHRLSASGAAGNRASSTSVVVNAPDINS